MPRPLAFCARLAAVALASSMVPSPALAAGGLSWSAVPIYQFDSDLDSGGEAGFTGVLASFGGMWPIAGGSSLGLRLRLDYEDWRFEDLSAFGGVEPWDQLSRVGVSVPYALVTEGGWRWSLTPTVEYAGESGARFSDALEYGASLAAARLVRPDLTLGLGLGVYSRLEETDVFPFVAVDWRIDDRWRLANPTATGPSGPAGLEIRYRLDSGWEVALGAAYRSDRFRLDRDGPFPGGIGEHQFVPVLASLGRSFGDSLTLRLYGGMAFGSKLRVEDENGRRLYDEDRDPAPMIGLFASGRF